MPGKGGRNGVEVNGNSNSSDADEMAAIEAITNALIQEVKASQEAASSPIANGQRPEIPEDDNEPKLLRIIIYETSVWQKIDQRF